MKYIEILANLLNLIGFVLLLDSSFRNLFEYWKKEIDAFGRKSYYMNNWYGWELKVKPALGLFLIFVGNFILLILSILQVI